MTNRNTILNELADLGSDLKDHNPQNIYAVPAGYFEGLAAQILNRIKALETSNAKEELAYLSPLLSNVSKEMPYAVPADYFQNFSDGMLQRLGEHTDYQTSEEEIETLSPLLSSLKNKNPYSAPAGYFKKLETGILRKDSFGEKKETEVISITKRRWYRLAVAAVVIGVIVIGGLVFFRSGQVDPKKNPESWVYQNVTKKISTEKIDEFVKLAEDETTANVAEENDATKKAEIKELMKDVSEKEIQDFLNDTVALEPNSETSTPMNE
jgi:hypothetical protein